MAAKFGPSLSITWWKLGGLDSSVMPAAPFASVSSPSASGATCWVKGALAAQHLTLTRSDLRSSRQTGVVLLTLRSHAGDLVLPSSQIMMRITSQALHFSHMLLSCIMSPQCLRLKWIFVLFVLHVEYKHTSM